MKRMLSGRNEPIAHDERIVIQRIRHCIHTHFPSLSEPQNQFLSILHMAPILQSSLGNQAKILAFNTQRNEYGIIGVTVRIKMNSRQYRLLYSRSNLNAPFQFYSMTEIESVDPICLQQPFFF